MEEISLGNKYDFNLGCPDDNKRPSYIAIVMTMLGIVELGSLIVKYVIKWTDFIIINWGFIGKILFWIGDNSYMVLLHLFSALFIKWTYQGRYDDLSTEDDN